MYRLSARQIIGIALLSSIFAAGAVVVFNRFSGQIQHRSSAAFSETPPEGITDPRLATDEQNNVEVYKALSPGVVYITSTSYQRGFFGEIEEGQGSGSGSVIDERGNILTNYHVIEGAQKLTVRFGGDKTYPARVIGGDPDTDLAVIKVEAPREQLTIVPLGDSDKLVVGQKVLAIGNPFGMDRTLTTGVISGLQRPIRARNGRPIEGAIQTDASINPGNSGGPLLNSHGQMIGINSQILSPSGASAGVGFAIPVNIAKRIVPQLLQYGVVRRPKLGIVPYNIKGIDRTQVRLPVSEGVMIYSMDPNGGAAAAGLQPLRQMEDGEIILGDIIVAIDGEKVSTSDDLYRILDKHQVGDTVKVEVARESGRVTVSVRLMAATEPRRSGIR